MKKSLALLLSLCMLLSFAACGNEPAEAPAPSEAPASSEAPAEKAPEESKTIAEFVVGTTAAIETATREEYNFDMLASAVSELPLVSQNSDGTYSSLMADFSTEDSTSWTFTIKEGMKWSDGEPVTAEDILFTMQYEDEKGGAYFHDQTNSKGKTTKAKFAGYELSEDKMSITLTLAKSNVRELSNMTSFRPMPKHIYEGNENLTDADKRIGCGPYKFDSFNKEAGTITFVVNEYFPETPNVEKITYKLFGNEDTMYMALTKGDIDMVWAYSTGVSSNYQDVLAEDKNVTLVNVSAPNAPAVLAFNNAKGFFSDENLRQAVSYALDYTAFKDYIGSSYAEIPNRGFVPTSTVGYKETAKLETNLETAASFMEKAGYNKNDAGIYVNADGKEAEFTLTIRSDKTNHVSCGDLIKTQLEKFGIKVNLEAIDSDSYNAKTSNKFSENNITMEAAIYGYTSAGMGMMNGLATIYVDGSHPVQGGCQVFDDEFVAIRDEMANAKVIDEYVAAAGKMQDFYAEHTPLIALYWDNMMYAHSAEFENLTVDQVFGLNNANTWFTITAK